MSIHERIKSKRIQLGLSQAALAKKTGVSQPTVANWETGSHIPRQGALLKICEALDVEEAWLISGDNTHTQHMAQAYLARPIRHLPVFQWPENGKGLYSTPPIDYITYPTRDENAFALLSRKKKTAKQRVMIFNPNTHGLKDQHLCLWTDGDVTACDPVKDIPTGAKLLGRLKTDIRVY